MRYLVPPERHELFRITAHNTGVPGKTSGLERCLRGDRTWVADEISATSNCSEHTAGVGYLAVRQSACAPIGPVHVSSLERSVKGQWDLPSGGQ